MYKISSFSNDGTTGYYFRIEWMCGQRTKCSSFSNDGTRSYYFRIEWMYGQCAQGVPRLVMSTQGVTINSHKGVTLLDNGFLKS